MRVVGTAVKSSAKAALDTNLLARARAVKGDIIRMLGAPHETCSKESDEVEP